MGEINRNSSHLETPQLDKLTLKNGLEATVDTKNGEIRLSNGESYKVSFTPAGGKAPLEMTHQQQVELAKCALAILKQSGHAFESLDKLTIQKDKITHFSTGEKQIIGANGEKSTDQPNRPTWMHTAAKTIDYFNKIIKGPEPEGKNNQKDAPLQTKNGSPTVTLHKDPKGASPSSFVSNLVPLNVRMESNDQIIFVHVPKGESHAHQPPVAPAGSKELQSSLSKLIISGNAPPQQLANTLVESLGEDVKKQIKDFKRENHNKISVLSEKGWVAAKKTEDEGGIGAKMADPKADPDEKGISYAQFRDNVNELVHKIVNEVGSKMGIPTTEKKIFGTPGYNSDKDIALNSDPKGKPLTTGEMVLIKSIADLVTTEIMGVLPGTALDTEWYVELKFMGKDVKGQEAQAQLATLDMAMGIMQAKEGLKNEPEQWKAFKERDLQQTASPIKEIKAGLYEQVEGFYKSLELDVGREIIFQSLCESGSNPKEARETVKELDQVNVDMQLKQIKGEVGDSSYDKKYYDAKVLAQYPKLMELGEKCAALEVEIANLKNQGSPNIEMIEKLIVQHDVLYALINSRQPEGTMSSSELKTTLFSEIGQKSARSREQGIEKFKERLKGSSQENEVKEVKEEKQTSPLMGIKSRQKKDRVMTKELLQQNEGAKGIANMYSEIDPGAKFTAQELILAGQERLGQFMHVVLHGHDPINAGKYCLRVAEANYFSLEKVMAQYEITNEHDSRQGKVPSELVDLHLKAKNMYQEAKYLEQCKRKFNLNGLAAQEMLFEKLSPGSSNKEQLKNDLKEMFAKQDFGYFESETRIKEEKIHEMCTILINKGHLNGSQVETVTLAPGIAYTTPTDPALRQIFEARVGYNQDTYAELRGMSTLKKILNDIQPEKKLENISGTIDGLKSVIGTQLKYLDKEKKGLEKRLVEGGEQLKSLPQEKIVDQNSQLISLRAEISKIEQQRLKYTEVQSGLEKGKVNPPKDVQKKLFLLGKELETEIENMAKLDAVPIQNLMKAGDNAVLQQKGFEGPNKNKEVEKFALNVESFSREVQNFMFKNEFMPKLSKDVNIQQPWSGEPLEG